MCRLGLTGPSLALLAMTAGSAEAHPVRHGLPVPQQQPQRPHLVIVEDNGGFVIRCETPRGPQDTRFPRGAIPLGASIHIDRAALQPSNQKDIDHGEIR
ncbi:hypothetical protein NT2_06_00730 [Caenibius tardaugens NBRC 16725]|uniref:Uncharacterized protein n=1 Tax=Caenibius tardaugens NBRC 16725 TaxID=1219035 RepID=U2ZW77_9SPHN|nr:hypothetical protein [Caenibius tardaugens]AZI37796.1 hypothetical protein EGO55_19025 [Caenibius tardaugens NBRC 16725]GAD49634.1 hypothetical protein NT2_06_00730 [Caenibius tardaugens NBRC 16725]